jgi:hypothetical protein
MLSPSATFARVPTNAVMASLARFDLNYVDKFIDRAAEWGAPVDDFLGEFREHTGVDLRTDILEVVGGTWGAYMSDSTGGGSLGSGIVFVSLKDSAKLVGAHRKLVETAGKHLAEEEKGMYIRPRIWKDGDVELMSLQFPGVPVPLEITYAVAGNWLIAGLTPQAVVTASRQALGKGDQGLVNHPALRGFASGSFSSVSIMDSARLARDGYPIMSMIGSAISAGVRSPGGGGRDPGLIVPTFAELVKGMKPTVEVSYWQGDDFVSETRADRSLLAQGAASMGMMSKFAPIIMGMAVAGAQAQNAGMGRPLRPRRPGMALHRRFGPRPPHVRVHRPFRTRRPDRDRLG